MPRYTLQFFDNLVADGSFESIVQIQGMIIGWQGIDLSDEKYGLPDSIFIFYEMLTWFSTSIRSGGWVYFESTSSKKQSAMLTGLQNLGWDDLADQYSYGSRNWKSRDAMPQHDLWIEQNESLELSRYFDLIAKYRSDFVAICI